MPVIILRALFTGKILTYLFWSVAVQPSSRNTVVHFTKILAKLLCKETFLKDATKGYLSIGNCGFLGMKKKIVPKCFEKHNVRASAQTLKRKNDKSIYLINKVSVVGVIEIEQQHRG